MVIKQMKRCERLRSLATKFDNDHILSITEKIILYAEMFTFEELKPFAEKPLMDLQTMLIENQNHDSLELMQEIYYAIGLEFHYDRPLANNSKTFYNDKQNVHKLVSTTKRIALKLINDYPGLYFRPPEFSDNCFMHFFEIIENTQYDEFSSKDLFASVYQCINSTIDKNTRLNLLNRLKEELKESDGMCFSGCVVRLINTIRGFGFEKYETIIDEYEYERSKVYYLINKICEHENIDLTRPSDLADKISNIVNTNKVHLSKKYGQRILESYTGLKWTRDHDKYYVSF